jgi:hypothetical protein
MDSDLFPLVNTEELFSMDILQKSKTRPPFDYSFAAAPNLVVRNEEGQDIIGGGFNAGFFVLRPDESIFNRIWDRALDPGQPWNYHRDMEQGLLNDFFATDSDAPMYRMHWSWNVKDMPDSLMSESKIVHARSAFLPPQSAHRRWWQSDPNLVGPKQNAEWWKTLGQVEGFWEAAP